MFVYIGLPHALHKLKAESSIHMKKINIPFLKVPSLDAVVQCGDILEEIEKKQKSLITSFYTTFKSNFYDDYQNADLPKSLDQLEKCLFVFDWDIHCISIEEAAELIVQEAGFIDKVYAEEYQKFAQCKKKHDALTRRFSGNLTELALNIVVPDSTSEPCDHKKSKIEANDDTHAERSIKSTQYNNIFSVASSSTSAKISSPTVKRESKEVSFLSTLYVTFLKEDEERFTELVNNIEKLSKDTILTVASDCEYKLVKLYILRSAEADIRKIILDGGFQIKEFDPDFKQKLNDFSVYDSCKKEFLRFLLSFSGRLIKFYSSIRMYRAYLDTVLYYGLPPNYVFFCCMGKEKKLVRFLVDLAEENEMINDEAEDTGDNVFGRVDMAIVEGKFMEFEE